MHRSELTRGLKLFVVVGVLTLAAACGSGDGEPVLQDTATVQQTEQLRLVFEDDFGGPNTAPRLAGRSALSVDNWRVVTGDGSAETGEAGWGNDEWQIYTDSTDNLYVEDGNLVIEAVCADPSANNCADQTANKRTGTITSARITTKDKLEIKYGVIQARISVPGGDGMWPAFWMLGQEWPEQAWPDVGEIDIMEMLYATSDRQTVHFTTHWAGPRTASTAFACGDTPGAVDPTNEVQNCVSDTYEFDAPIANDNEYHVFEVDWNAERIIGKVDGITYYTKTIDGDMEEFNGAMYLLLNLAVGGQGGLPSANTSWPQKMKVDWVRVFERPKPTSGSLLEGTLEPNYVRAIQSQEFGGDITNADLNSNAVTPFEGDTIVKIDFTNTASGNPNGGSNGFNGLFFSFGPPEGSGQPGDFSNFTEFTFSIDTSEFPNFDDLTIELKDQTDRLIQVKLSDFTFVEEPGGNGTRRTYTIPLSAFAGVDVGDVLHLGFINTVDVNDALIAGTLYLDAINFAKTQCTTASNTPTATVAFDATNYRPDATLAQVTVNDICAANSLVPVEIEAGANRIVVGVDLDAAGNGSSIFEFGAAASICPVSDGTSSIVLAAPLTATYNATGFDTNGAEITVQATATAGIDAGATVTAFEGEKSYIIANDPNQVAAFALDSDFQLSDFNSGSQFVFPVTDAGFAGPVWSVSDLAGQDAVFAMFGFSAGYTDGQATINFSAKDLPGDVVNVRFTDPGSNVVTIDLTDTTFSTLNTTTGWYDVSIPMDQFPDPSSSTFLVISSNNSSTTDFTFFITDIFLQAQVGTRGAECVAPLDAPAAPTENAADVISIYSNTYGNNVTVDTFAASFGTAQSVDIEVVPGNNIRSYDNLGFTAIETVSAPIDATGMTNFRIDVWSPTVTTLEVKWVDFAGDGFGNGNDTEGAVTLAVTPNQWNSLDIPLADLQSAGLTNRNFLSQLIIAVPQGAPSGPLYVDNIYFYDTGFVPSTDPVVFADDFGAGVSFTPFGGIDDVTIDTAEAFAGTASLRVGVPATNFTGGALAVNPGRDVSRYDVMTFWAKASQLATLNVVGVGNDAVSATNATEVTNLALTTEWQRFIIRPADPSVLTSNTGLFHFAEGSEEGAYTIWFDEIRYGTDPVVFDDNFGVGVSFATFGGIDDISVDTVEAFSGAASLRVGVPATNFTGGALAVPVPGRDVSAYDNLTFWAKASQAANLNVAGVGNDAVSATNATEVTNLALTTDWQQFTITPTDPSVLTANTGLFHFAEGSEEGAYTIWFDDIAYTNIGNGAGGGGGTEIAADGGFEGSLVVTDNWQVDPAGGAGTAVIETTDPRTGSNALRFQNPTQLGPAITIKQVNRGQGQVSAGDTVTMSFWAKGTIGTTCNISSQLIYEGTGGTPTIDTQVAGAVSTTAYSEITFSGTASGDVLGGVTIQISAACGPEGVVDVMIDDLSVTFTTP